MEYGIYCMGLWDMVFTVWDPVFGIVIVWDYGICIWDYNCMGLWNMYLGL